MNAIRLGWRCACTWRRRCAGPWSARRKDASALRVAARLGAVVLAAAPLGCVSTVVATPSAVHAPVHVSPDAPKRERLRAIAAAFDAHPVVYPRSRVLAGIAPGILTLGGQASEMGQAELDQEPVDSFPPGTRVLDAAGLARATQSASFTAGSHAQCPRDYGNVPVPDYASAWIPLPVRPDRDDAAVPATVACPAPAGSGYFCLHARLALQPHDAGSPAAPMIFVLPGLFHSSEHAYVRDTGSVLFARGYSVGLLDPRDHGGTFHGQPWLPSTLGALEGDDVVGVARYVASLRPPDGSVIRQFGVVGYSGGGMFGMRALVADRSGLLSDGVVAISPIVDLEGTVRRMSRTGSCFVLDLKCVGRRAMASYFMDLLTTRMAGLGPRPEGGAFTAEDYLTKRILAFPVYAGMPDPRATITPAHVAEQIVAAVPAASPPALAVLSSDDDPVVAGDAAAALRRRLGDDPRAAVYIPRRGGHIAFSVLSPSVTRAFLRAFFDAPCAPGD